MSAELGTFFLMRGAWGRAPGYSEQMVRRTLSSPGVSQPETRQQKGQAGRGIIEMKEGEEGEREGEDRGEGRGKIGEREGRKIGEREVKGRSDGARWLCCRIL